MALSEHVDELLPVISQTLASSAAEVDRLGAFPAANFALLRQHGLLSFALPTSAGGAGADLAACRTVIAAVAQGEPSTALILIMQYLNARRLGEDSSWPAGVRRAVADSILERGALINALRVEPELGTPARGGLPATTARRTADGWRLSGEKIYSTGSVGLSWFLVWARSDDEDPLVGAWLVPASASGIRIKEEWDHLGMRATCSHRVVLEDVWVPRENAVNLSRWSAPRPGLNEEESLWMAVLLGSLYDAIARGAQREFIHFLQQRVPANLGRPLASLARFQDVAGRIETLLFTSRTLLNSAAAGEIAAADAAKVKQVTIDNAIRSVQLMVEHIGNHALTRTNGFERHLRNVLCGRIHTPQDDVIFTAAGQAVLQSSRSK
ncbi:acyl-CoA dehydrogenase [Candidatus Pantoea deserta]|uniref:Acyl-CoA dehydrogenase n=1 Tax=Candidatus Pantoea deserta TaxID=1869313 RepID=A0A3N4NUD1_9GAMM|nr:acyl-CoA dehydrogenase family protein [Pantoea deserta]RPD99764.1 acyl-CoA dehydrogenase [Pantoea deserta]